MSSPGYVNSTRRAFGVDCLSQLVTRKTLRHLRHDHRPLGIVIGTLALIGATCLGSSAFWTSARPFGVLLDPSGKFDLPPGLVELGDRLEFRPIRVQPSEIIVSAFEKGHYISALPAPQSGPASPSGSLLPLPSLVDGRRRVPFQPQRAIDSSRVGRQFAMGVEFANRGALGNRPGDPRQHQLLDDAVGARPGAPRTGGPSRKGRKWRRRPPVLVLIVSVP